MNSIFLRMKKLLEESGISFTEGGISNAETYAYASGLHYVTNYLRTAFYGLFLENNSEAKSYAFLLNIDPERYTDEGLVNEIKRRLAMPFGEGTVEEFEDAFAAVGSGTYSLFADPDDGFATIVFSGVSAGDLPQLGKFIEAYTCNSNRILYDGDGMDFDAWDNWGQCWHKLDRMALPFNIIDRLRSDMIEQH